jgi:hypothetical protein
LVAREREEEEGSGVGAAVTEERREGGEEEDVEAEAEAEEEAAAYEGDCPILRSTSSISSPEHTSLSPSTIPHNIPIKAPHKKNKDTSFAGLRRSRSPTPSKISRWHLIYPNSRTRAVKTTQFRLGLVFYTTPLDCHALTALPERV